MSTTPPEEPRRPARREDARPAPAEHDDERTFAGNVPLSRRWWWSPLLMVVVGGVVIGYQVSAYTGDGGIWLNGVMIAIGAGVVGAGLVSLHRAWVAQRDTTGR